MILMFAFLYVLAFIAWYEQKLEKARRKRN